MIETRGIELPGFRIAGSCIAGPFLIAAVLAPAPPPSAAPAPAPLSFKEVAALGGAIVMAGCITDGRGSVTCTSLEAWRETAPKKPIVIARDDWGRFPVEVREERPEGRFLIIIQPRRDAGCVMASPKSGGALRRVGNVDTCVVPIVDGRLPKELRRWYDHTQGPALTIAQLKADLLSPSKAAFIDRARYADCANVRNRLFVIDDKLVFWERAGSCPDNAYGATLFGDTVDDVLCYFGDTIAGPRTSCPVPGHEAMFETITGHLDEPDLGLGPGHTVQELPL
jgi:hypothetical protein